VVWERGVTNLADFFTKYFNKEGQQKMSDIFSIQVTY
jgi:hypothetical protein